MTQIKRLARLFAGLLLLCSMMFAQGDTPTYSIYLADIKGTDMQLSFGRPVKITHTRGYNNQPSFSLDGKRIFYTAANGTQTDVYAYELTSRTTSQATKTPESEYSPQAIPGRPTISTVRVEMDSTQRLWSTEQDGSKAKPLFPNQKGVGYYCWIDESRCALFILGKNDTDTLKVLDVNGANAPLVIATKIGRGLQRVPMKGGLSFIQRKDDTTSFVDVYDFKEKKTYELLKTFPGVQDFVWTKDDYVIMANGPKLFIAYPPDDKKWRELADFSTLGLKKISRMAISPKGDKIAMVVEDDPNGFELSPLWSVHIDEVEHANQPTFDEWSTNEAGRKAWVFGLAKEYLSPSYEFATDGGMYFTLRAKTVYEELDRPEPYSGLVKQGLKNRVASLDDSIHTMLRFHHNEMWSFDVEGSYASAAENGHPLLLDHIRLHKEMVRPGAESLYDSAIAMMRGAFVKAKLSQTVISFYSSYGSGENIHVWFDSTKDGCDVQAIESELHANAEAWKEYSSAKDMVARCIVGSSDSYAVVRRDLSGLDSAASFLGFR